MNDVIRFEAEDLRLNGYGVENIKRSTASAGKHISLRGKGERGTASGTFTGEAGLYDVSVGFFDEDDGAGSAKVDVAGNVQSFLLDKDLPGNWVGAQTHTNRTTHQKTAIQPGARFTIEGKRDRGEFARFDYIEFSKVGDIPAPKQPAPNSVPKQPAPEQPAPEQPAPTTERPQSPDSPAKLGFGLGTNLSGIKDWSTQYPFKDFFKNARAWIPVREGGAWDEGASSQVNVDDKGWVKSLSAFSEMATLVPNAPKFDRYVVTYEGEGTLLFPNNPVVKDESGRKTISAPGSDVIDLRILETDPNGTGDYLRNIQVVPEPFVDLPASQVFNPDFVADLKGFETLRFMDWMDTNFSEQGEWGNRPEPNDSIFSDGKGVPVEWMVDLANQTGIDPWFNMPHEATDEYVRKFADYVKNNLDPKLNAFVEYSNEIWNEQFGQRSYVEEKRKQLSGTGDTPPWIAYHAQRSSDIGRIWDDVFGGQKARAVGVLGSYSADTGTSQKAIDYLKEKNGSLEAAGIDRLAIAPYFGGALGSPANKSTLEAWTKESDGGLSKIFKELNEGNLLAHSAVGGVMYHFGEEVARNVAVAEKEGIELIAYEGGQHILPYGATANSQAITDLFIKANQDPRMGELYKEYFKTWQEKGGGLFANFSDIGVPGKYGSFGAKTSLYQKSSPKWDALQETIRATPGWAQRGELTEPDVSLGGSEGGEVADIVSGADVSDDGAKQEDVVERSPIEGESAGDKNAIKKVLHGELLDLTEADVNQDGQVDKLVELTFDVLNSSNGYDNTLGYYEIDSAEGGVLNKATGDRVLPGDLDYAEVALRNRVDSIDLNRDTSMLSVQVEGGTLLAPFLIANGTVDGMLEQNPLNKETSKWGKPNAYFSFVEANPDGFDHIRGSGERLETEDLWGGGDQSFTDFVVSVDVTALA